MGVRIVPLDPIVATHSCQRHDCDKGESKTIGGIPVETVGENTKGYENEKEVKPRTK